MSDRQQSELNFKLRGVPSEIKSKEGEEDRSSGEGIVHPQMRLGTVLHGMIEGRFLGSPKSQGFIDFFSRLKSQESEETGGASDIVSANLAMAVTKLSSEIRQTLPEGESAYPFAETRFQKSAFDLQKIARLMRKNEVNELVRKSGYENLPEMIRTMLLSEEGEVTIGEKNFTLKEMVATVRQSEIKGKAVVPGQAVMDDIYRQGQNLPEKNVVNLMKVLVGVSTHHYFSKTEGGIQFSLIASAIARTDLLFFTAKMGTKADDFLKKNYPRLFGTDMHDIERLVPNMKVYEELMKRIMDGEIKMTMVEIKTSSLRKIITPNGEQRVRYEEGSKQIRDAYSGQMAHQAIAAVQTFLGLNRLLGLDEAKGLNEILSINPDNKKEKIRSLTKFLRTFYKQKFVVARLHVPMFDVVIDGESKSYNFVPSSANKSPTTSVTELDTRVDVRQKASEYYDRMLQLIAETS